MKLEYMVLLSLLQIGSSSTILVAIALIIIIGYVSTAIFRRTRVPELLILMLIGIFLVQVANAVPANYLDVLRSLAPIFSSLALVVIMFNGSKELRFDDSVILKSGKGLALGMLDNLLSLIAVAAFMYYVFGWPLVYGAILGAILGETTNIVVIPFIRRVKLEPDMFGAMFSETILNSLVAITMFSLLLLVSSNQIITALSFTTYVLDYLSFAIVMGLIAGIGWIFVINTLKGAREYLATLAVAILLYGVVDIFNGAAIISILIFGMLIGNEKSINYLFKLNKKPAEEDSYEDLQGEPEGMETGQASEKAAEKELEFLISTFFFVFMGMITILSVQYLLYGLIITAILIALRYIEVQAVLRKKTPEDRKLALALMPRGITAATLATILYGIGGTYFTQTFYISFIVIVTTSIISSLMLNRVAVEMKEE